MVCRISNKKFYRFSVVYFFLSIFTTHAFAVSFLDFNSGDGGTDFPGWNWSSDVAYGNEGWILSSDPVLGAANSYLWGVGPRSMNKSDYGALDAAVIDSSVRAPSTAVGNSLKLYSLPGSTDNQVTWWLWYDGIPLIDRGLADENTDRLGFYAKIEGVEDLMPKNESTELGETVHVGAYLCWNSGAAAYGTGDGCPYEGPGNQHYYHYLNIDSGAWVHVLIDNHPQHLRGDSGGIGYPNDNPVASYGKNYLAQLNQMYIEVRYPQPVPTTMWLDEFRLFSTKDTIEPNQNEVSVSSLWVGYWGDKDEWRMGFWDTSFSEYKDDTFSTFEIRWSLQPITNANYSSANIIQPKLYSGSEHAGSTDSHALRRVSAYKKSVFTTFDISLQDIGDAPIVYFGVKDISKKGMHVGSKWPWNKGDYRDAPNNLVKTIDYHLDSSTIKSKPNSPIVRVRAVEK